MVFLCLAQNEIVIRKEDLLMISQDVLSKACFLIMSSSTSNRIVSSAKKIVEEYDLGNQLLDSGYSEEDLYDYARRLFRLLFPTNNLSLDQIEFILMLTILSFNKTDSYKKLQKDVLNSQVSKIIKYLAQEL